MNETTHNRLIRIREVKDRTGLSAAKVYCLIRERQFPAPLKLGDKISLWLESDVDQWITNLVNKSKEVLA